MRRFLLRGALAALLISASATVQAQELGGCPVYPKNHIWNTPIQQMPVHPNSARFIESEGPDRNLHPDFGPTGGIPYVVVPATQAKVPITLESTESDPGPYPIPPNVPIEAGEDNHALVLQQGDCKLYEVYALRRAPSGAWLGSSGAIFDLRSNFLRPDGWTSADAAGLAILPGLVRYDEIEAGEIRHAIRLTVPKTRKAYVWPARHFASKLTEDIYPPMGTRFRLKAGYDITGFPKEVQVLLRALKKYGMVVADNGQSWFLTGSPDKRWNDETWSALKRVKGIDLEAVNTDSLMINANSGQAGVVSTVGLNEVSWSATPAFDLQVGTQSLLLTGDVTSSSVLNLSEGQQVGFIICQDDLGGRNFTWPANVRGAMRVSTVGRTCSAQQFLVRDQKLYATSPGVTDLPVD